MKLVIMKVYHDRQKRVTKYGEVVAFLNLLYTEIVLFSGCSEQLVTGISIYMSALTV